MARVASRGIESVRHGIPRGPTPARTLAHATTTTSRGWPRYAGARVTNGRHLLARSHPHSHRLSPRHTGGSAGNPPVARHRIRR